MKVVRALPRPFFVRPHLAKSTIFHVEEVDLVARDSSYDTGNRQHALASSSRTRVNNTKASKSSVIGLKIWGKDTSLCARYERDISKVSFPRSSFHHLLFLSVTRLLSSFNQVSQIQQENAPFELIERRPLSSYCHDERIHNPANVSGQEAPPDALEPIENSCRTRSIRWPYCKTSLGIWCRMLVHGTSLYPTCHYLYARRMLTSI